MRKSKKELDAELGEDNLVMYKFEDSADAKRKKYKGKVTFSMSPKQMDRTDVGESPDPEIQIRNENENNITAAPDPDGDGGGHGRDDGREDPNMISKPIAFNSLPKTAKPKATVIPVKKNYIDSTSGLQYSLGCSLIHFSMVITIFFV